MLSEEPRCAEYCFQFCFNPYQHPSFNYNKHHLDALLAALSNSCGGLVFLTAEEAPQKTIQFSTFPPSSRSTSDRVESETSETSELDFPCNVWSVIKVKKSAETEPCDFNGERVEVKIDINGNLRYVQHSGEQLESVANPAHEREQRNPKADTDPDPYSKHAPQPPITKPRVDDVADSEPPVEVSELNWDKNKINWPKILQKADESIDECINSCDFLEPRIPMQIMAEKDSLRYLIPSGASLEETLHKIATKKPGFAISNRSWMSLLPDGDLQERPTNHLCDILTVSKSEDLKPSICLWVVVSGSKEHIIQKQVRRGILFFIGRHIKPIILMILGIYLKRFNKKGMSIPQERVRLLYSTKALGYTVIKMKENMEKLSCFVL